MLEIIEFVLGGFWRWLGTVLLILAFGKTFRGWAAWLLAFIKSRRG